MPVRSGRSAQLAGSLGVGAVYLQRPDTEGAPIRISLNKAFLASPESTAASAASGGYIAVFLSLGITEDVGLSVIKTLTQDRNKLLSCRQSREGSNIL